MSTVQYTSVSHCSLHFECPRLGCGFLSIILVLEFAMNPVTGSLSSVQQVDHRCRRVDFVYQRVGMSETWHIGKMNIKQP